MSMPIMLDGLPIHIDASLPHDQSNKIPRSARLGVFIIGHGMHQSFNVYIKAFILNASSLFMAEEAALALA
jgi:hypothetical protein